MSSFLKDVGDELKALVIATIPSGAATSTNVYNVLASSRVRLFDLISGGDFALPVWVIEAADMVPETQFGIHNNAKRCPVKITEIRQVDETDTQDKVFADLHLIERAIRNTARTSFMMVEEGRIMTSPSEPTVKAFLDAGVNATAGTLSYSPGLLCGDFPGA